MTPKNCLTCNFSLQYQYILQPTVLENKETYQLDGVKLMHLAAFENSSKIFLRCIFITLDLLLLRTFVDKALDYQFDYILSLELEQKFGLRCP